MGAVASEMRQVAREMSRTAQHAHMLADRLELLTLGGGAMRRVYPVFRDTDDETTGGMIPK